jgi:hypothetical protein
MTLHIYLKMARQVLIIYEGHAYIYTILHVHIPHSTLGTKTTPSGLPEYVTKIHQGLTLISKG